MGSITNTTMSFEHFTETLETLPPEVERNFALMTDLDKQQKEIIDRINATFAKYRGKNFKEERLAIRREVSELFDKLEAFADDKYSLADQLYNLIDKNISRLTSLGEFGPSNGTSQDSAPIGFDMPVDPNEPIYCFCRTVSHGEMIACDNPECAIEWFHYPCVGLTKTPRGKWYCPQCLNSTIKKKKSRSRKPRRYY